MFIPSLSFSHDNFSYLYIWSYSSYQFAFRIAAKNNI